MNDKIKKRINVKYRNTEFIMQQPEAPKMSKACIAKLNKFINELNETSGSDTIDLITNMIHCVCQHIKDRNSACAIVTLASFRITISVFNYFPDVYGLPHAFTTKEDEENIETIKYIAATYFHELETNRSL